jgi:hypothetical protein
MIRSEILIKTQVHLVCSVFFHFTKLSLGNLKFYIKKSVVIGQKALRSTLGVPTL